MSAEGSHVPRRKIETGWLSDWVWARTKEVKGVNAWRKSRNAQDDLVAAIIQS